MYKTINKGDKLYFARVHHATSIYDLCELIVRTVADTYFVGTDKKDKRAYLFGYDSLGETVFQDRKEALAVVQKAEKEKKEVGETYYEEY